MMKIYLSICSVLCFAVVIFHQMAGASVFLDPLASSGLDKNVIGMLIFSWHSNSIFIFGLAHLFAYAAFIPNNKMMAVVATGMASGLGILAYMMTFLYDPVMWQTPAPAIWIFISIISIVGLYSSLLETAHSL